MPSGVRAERAIWLCLALGIVLHGSGWLVDFVAYHGVAPTPSFSDPLWLGAYLGFYPGVVLLGRERSRAAAWACGSTACSVGWPSAVTAATALQASLGTWTPPAAPPSPAPPTHWPTSHC